MTNTPRRPRRSPDFEVAKARVREKAEQAKSIIRLEKGASLLEYGRLTKRAMTPLRYWNRMLWLLGNCFWRNILLTLSASASRLMRYPMPRPRCSIGVAKIRVQDARGISSIADQLLQWCAITLNCSTIPPENVCHL